MFSQRNVLPGAIIKIVFHVSLAIAGITQSVTQKQIWISSEQKPGINSAYNEWTINFQFLAKFQLYPCFSCSLLRSFPNKVHRGGGSDQDEPFLKVKML